MLIYEKVTSYVGRKEPSLREPATQEASTQPNELVEEEHTEFKLKKQMSLIHPKSSTASTIMKPPIGKHSSGSNMKSWKGLTDSQNSPTRVIRFTASNGFGKQSFVTDMTTPHSEEVSQQQRREQLEKNLSLVENSRDSLEDL